MAYALAMSIRLTQSEVNRMSVCVSPGQYVPGHYRAVFDQVIELPWEDDAEQEEWKVHNKWKYIHVTPYDETVFLDADMLFLSDVSHWWELMSQQEMWMCTRPMTYRGYPADNSYYREVFTKNDLPNTYNAFTYFQKTPLTFEVFEYVKLITHNWEKFEYEYLSEKRPKSFSMDVAFALALKLTDSVDSCTNRYYSTPRFVHMKSQSQGWQEEGLQEDWTKHVVPSFSPDLVCKIGGYRILDPLHYHVKHFLTDDIVKYYENACVLSG
jgi:hypothetical protein